MSKLGPLTVSVKNGIQTRQVICTRYLPAFVIMFSLRLNSRTNGFAPSSPEIGMHVEIRDPDDKIILSKVGPC